MRAAARLLIVIGAVALGCGGLGVGACRSSRSAAEADGKVSVAPAGPVVVLHANERALAFRVELATTEPQRERGLMYRNHLDADAGMLFVFDREGPLTFWMKNTFIPLDIIFIGADQRIIGIVENATPETETPRRVNGLSRYVLELPGGTTGRLGIVAGTSVEFQGLPREAIGG